MNTVYSCLYYNTKKTYVGKEMTTNKMLSTMKR